MLLVKTKLDQGPIHRFGVFAEDFIPKSTRMWQFAHGFDLEKTPANLAALPAHIQTWAQNSPMNVMA